MVRILYTTDEFNDEILESLKDIPQWLTKGDNLRVYWSENHQIMYTSNGYLLRQRFNDVSVYILFDFV